MASTITHIEDNVIHNGYQGIKEIINILENIDKNKISIKWDGAPAIIAGLDPINNQFFIGTKSILNSNRKKYFSINSIESDKNLSYGLKSKLLDAFRYIDASIYYGIKHGDLLYTNDRSIEPIKNIMHHIFQANTIIYGIPVDSKIGKQIEHSKMGIIWHTTYTTENNGKLIPNYNNHENNTKNSTNCFENIFHLLIFTTIFADKYKSSTLLKWQLKKLPPTGDFMKS